MKIAIYSWSTKLHSDTAHRYCCKRWRRFPTLRGRVKLCGRNGAMGLPALGNPSVAPGPAPSANGARSSGSGEGRGPARRP